MRADESWQHLFQRLDAFFLPVRAARFLPFWKRRRAERTMPAEFLINAGLQAGNFAGRVAGEAQRGHWNQWIAIAMAIPTRP